MRRPNQKSDPLAARALPAGVALLVAVGLLAAACSSPSTAGSVASLPGHGSASQTTGALTVSQSDQDMVHFTRCLRSHGVAEPDPFHRPGHDGLSVDIPTPGPTTNAALSACNHFLAPIAQLKQAGARQQLSAWLPALTHYAECMRTHDIAMLDPDAQGSLNLGNVPGISNGFGRYTPQFRAADTACRHLLPSAVRDDGTGP
ncbi:MAG TPA: hypothetical protein VNY84_00210 [Acidimicrobiales bacterium]|jgi:hypothetical protein|nr:hypothetical protein [Acidimicrobiales bacterium]